MGDVDHVVESMGEYLAGRDRGDVDDVIGEWRTTLASLRITAPRWNTCLDEEGNVLTPMPTTHCPGSEVKNIGGFMRCTVCNVSYGPAIALANMELSTNDR